MDSKKEKDQVYRMAFIFATILILMNAYYFGVEWLIRQHIASSAIGQISEAFAQASFMKSPYTLKWWALALIFFTFFSRSGSRVDMGWGTIIAWLVVGCVLYFMPLIRPGLYVVTTLFGYSLVCFFLSMLVRKFSTFRDIDNDMFETFQQCEKLIPNDMSVNFPTIYRWKHRNHHGWVNVIQPQRGTLILGTPGSGKSFSLYHGFIEQMIRKHFSLVVYDFKMPDLAEVAYNYYLKYYPDMAKKGAVWHKGMKDSKGHPIPQFCVINFDDPRYSMRCNPIHPMYINDPADTTEIADIIMRNINPDSVEKEDFFSMSAKVLIDGMVLFLRVYKNGIYCDFPHLIELMACSYERVFELLDKFPEIRVKLTPFANALKGGAQEQLQGQIASAQIPLMRFASPALYWVLSGNDFTLDVNNPDAPKIMILGNNPDRQSIYSTTHALITSRNLREINHKGKIPCGLLLDEFPTIRIKDIDKVISTARSNKVCVVLGAQDKSQIVQDYGEKNAEVIFNTVGNILSGQVNGRTAKELSETFGREFRMQQSRTTGGENDTVNTSYHKQEILPQSQIEQLSPGTFFGKVADSNNQIIERKLFCGAIQVDMQAWNELKSNWKKIPRINTTSFGDMAVRGEVLGLDASGNVVDKDAPERNLKMAINNEIIREDQARKAMDETYNVRRFTRLEEAVETEYRRICSDKSLKQAKLEKIIAEREQEEVDRVLKKNYEKIKQDIVQIFADLNVPMDPPKKRA